MARPEPGPFRSGERPVGPWDARRTSGEPPADRVPTTIRPGRRGVSASPVAGIPRTRSKQPVACGSCCHRSRPIWTGAPPRTAGSAVPEKMGRQPLLPCATMYSTGHHRGGRRYSEGRSGLVSHRTGEQRPVTAAHRIAVPIDAGTAGGRRTVAAGETRRRSRDRPAPPAAPLTRSHSPLLKVRDVPAVETW